MRRILALIAVAALASSAFSQSVPSHKVSAVAGAGSITYTWFTTNDNVRGMTYNPATQHLLVAERAVGSIKILSGVDLSVVGSMDITGLSAAPSPTYTVHKPMAASDGVIHMGTLASAAATHMKIWRWANEAATPVCVLDYTATARMGDTWAETGTGKDTIILCGNSALLYLWKFTYADQAAYDAGTMTAVQVTPTPAMPAFPQHMAFSPDGQSYFLRPGNGVNGTYKYRLSDNTQIANYADGYASGYCGGIGVCSIAGGTDTLMAYVIGSDPAASTNAVGLVRRESAFATAVDTLAAQGAGPLTSMSLLKPPSASRNGAVAIDVAHKTIYTLDPGNAICRYPALAYVPVHVSGFSVE